MINKIIEYVSQNSASNAKVYNMIKIMKAKSSNGDIIDGLSNIEASISIAIKRDKMLLTELKNGLEGYSQQFASEFNLMYEIVNNNFLILSKVKGGYHVLLTSKDGSTIISKTYINQIKAMEYFVELYKTK